MPDTATKFRRGDLHEDGVRQFWGYEHNRYGGPPYERWVTPEDFAYRQAQQQAANRERYLKKRAEKPESVFGPRRAELAPIDLPPKPEKPPKPPKESKRKPFAGRVRRLTIYNTPTLRAHKFAPRPHRRVFYDAPEEEHLVDHYGPTTPSRFDPLTHGKEIPDHPHYVLTPDGIVWRIKAPKYDHPNYVPKRMVPQIAKKGYAWFVQLRTPEGKTVNHYLRRLMPKLFPVTAEQFESLPSNTP